MATIDLPADCSLRSAKALHANLSEAFGKTGDLVIDCSALTTCDIAGVQILASAMRTAQASGRNLTLAGETAALNAVLARAGISLSVDSDRILINEV